MNHVVTTTGNFGKSYDVECACGYTSSFNDYLDARKDAEDHRFANIEEVSTNKQLVLSDYCVDYQSGLVYASAPSNLKKINEETQAWVPEGTVIGRVIEWHVPCKMTVGQGAKVHNGRYTRYVIEAEGLMIREDRRITGLASGECTTEPMNSCGANANHRFGGYTGFTRNSNRRYPDEYEVTCTKCLKQAHKKESSK